MRKVFNIFNVVTILLALNLVTTAQAAPPQIRISAGGLNYMTGGIGHDEVLEMRPFAKKFTLNLLFSEGATGRSVTDVNVNIYNEQDEMVFRVRGAKPVLYVNLPAGTYTILANNNGLKLRHKLSIEENINQKVILNWKDEVEEDALMNEVEN
jgi:hypothetical protein